MSLEIFPTYPKIRADQIEGDWSSELISIIEEAASSAVNDDNVSTVINTGAKTQAAIKNLIRAQVDQSFLDPLVAGLINNETSQTRAILDTIINDAIASPALNYNGEVDGRAADWNTLTTPGYYRITAREMGGSNQPPVVPQSGVLLVLPHGGPLTQIFLGDVGAYAFRRYDTEWRPWQGRTNRVAVADPIGVDPFTGEIILNSSTYKTLYTIRLPNLIWPGDDPLKPTILVQVFGKLTYIGTPDTVSYIRLTLQRMDIPIETLDTIRASTDGVYSLAWAGKLIPSADVLIVEARTEGLEPARPSPRLLSSVEGGPASWVTIII